MKASTAVLLLLLLPTAAAAADGGGQEFSFVAAILQMIAALGLVVGMILVVWYFAGKLMGGLPQGQRLLSRHIRLIETRYMGPKKTLILVEVGGQYLLLAGSDSGIRLIKQIDMLEDIEVVEEKPDKNRFANLLDRLRKTP